VRVDGRELRLKKETMALTSPFVLKALFLLGFMHMVMANNSDEVCCIHHGLFLSRSSFSIGKKS